jgi:putative glycosyltransferase (TIGR04372 family)
MEFVARHTRQIQIGGWIVLREKLICFARRVRYVASIALTFTLLIVPLMVIRAIRPWRVIRFGMLESDGIGHFSVTLDTYLSEQDCAVHGTDPRCIDVWYLRKTVCNRVLLGKWAERFRIWPRALVQPLDFLNRLVPGGAAHEIPYRYLQNTNVPWQIVDIHGVLDRTETHIQFSADEVAIGARALRSMGIVAGDRMVCFNVYDGTYHGDVGKDGHRQASIGLVMPGIEALTERGYRAVRMGAKVREALGVPNPRIVDYASNGIRSELLDLFLVSRCTLFVSNGTGMDAVARMFRRPLALVSIPQFGFVDELNANVVFIPKHVWSIQQKRMLTFREIFERGIHLFAAHWLYRGAGLESVDNTAKEIVAAVLEMEQRISGAWTSTPEDDALQERFRALWPRRPNGGPLRARIGSQFLRDNQHLLV